MNGWYLFRLAVTSFVIGLVNFLLGLEAIENERLLTCFILFLTNVAVMGIAVYALMKEKHRMDNEDA